MSADTTSDLRPRAAAVTFRLYGRLAQHRGYTLEGAYTFAAATTGRSLDADELGAVADGWNDERVLIAMGTFS